jgi:hypothetical protein
MIKLKIDLKSKYLTLGNDTLIMYFFNNTNMKL